MVSQDMPAPQAVNTQSVGDESPAIKAGWLRCLLFLVMFVVFSILQSLFMALVAGISSQTDMTLRMAEPSGILVMGGMLAGAVLIVLLFRKLVDRRSFVSLGFSFDREKRTDLLAGILWGTSLISAVFLVSLLSGAVVVRSVGFPVGGLVNLLVVLTMAAVLEELVFRGYLLNNLMTSVNKYLALILVSVLFAIGHVGNPNASMIGLVNIILAGLLLGIYYIHKQNLWFPIGLHLAWNFFQGPVLGAPVSGVELPSVLAIEITGSELLTGGSFGFEASLTATLLITAAIILFHLKYREKKPSGQAQGMDLPTSNQGQP